MRIVKPYGRSHVEYAETDPAGATRRVLGLRSEPDKRRDIEQFARSHDELVMAQWISTLDKIATKPAGKNGPTDEQRRFRDRLGQAAWTLLVAKGLLPGSKDAERKEYLAKLWKAKVHPYGTTPYGARKDRQGRAFPPPSPKGRWYARFAGSVEVAEVDAGALARKIFAHLHEAEYRIHPGRPNRRQGRIAARAKSIAGNVPRPGSPARAGTWTPADREAYARAGNVAQEIRRAAEAREAGEDQAGTRRVTPDIAAAALFGHYARLFRGHDGTALSIRDARTHAPGLFDLHMAVKDCYARILKRHKKDRKAHGDRRRKVSDLLPDTMDRLFALVDAKGANRDLNALVRLGKVVHYQSSGGGDDRPADIVNNWPADVTRSEYWTSDGQARIKRNEAFVRVWRHVLALAQRTLTDWADPKGRENDDILLAGPIRRATEERFDAGSYGRKLALLYGKRADLFTRNGDDAFRKSVLRLALAGTAALRHGSFHFKGLGGFAKALTEPVRDVDARVRAAVRKLWETDLRERAERLRQTMQGAHCDCFFDESQNRRLFAALADTGVAALPLPRVNGMLRRADNAWRDNLRLPAPANRADLENPARLCQYTALKLLYERPFRTWLETRDAKTLNGFIDAAVARGTKAARAMNANDGRDRDLIVARAASLGRLADGEGVQTFFFNLSAETAREMRVQRGYESDPDRAREQADYIEYLKCDVVALAYRAYLKEAGCDFLLELSPDTRKPDRPRCSLDEMPLPEADTDAEDWQTTLYFLIHLVPADEIGKLLHQMRKWELLAKDSEPADKAAIDRVRRIRSVLELYLDMHDAKFEGGAALVGTDAFKGLFESAADFARVFPAQPGADDDRRLPKRGLREIVRFGHRPVLQPIFAKHPIAAKAVDEYLLLERVGADGRSEIARLQESRESLHEEWVEKKKGFSDGDLKAYVEALSGVVRHRYLAARVTLTNHVRLHRLLMAVLGRLVDYSGLWERDLYFAALALIREAGCRPKDVFTDDGLKRLGDGQIVAALRNLQTTDEAQTVKDRSSRYFGAVWEKNNLAAQIRKDFAHFNMLKAGSPPVDLTKCANDARDLMAYDRKLRNAVSQSVKELLHREGLELEWTMGADHRLGAATLGTRQAQHLGGKRLPENRGPKPRKHPIRENLRGDGFVATVASLFDRGAPQPRKSLLDIPLAGIDWERSAPAGDRGRSVGKARGSPSRSREKPRKS